MRILHFSDTHYGTWPKHLLGALFDKRILGLTNYLARRRRSMHAEYVEQAVAEIVDMKPDVVVCSGDITVIGSPVEFKAACRQFQPLVEHPDIEFLYVPGNHDAYTGAACCKQALHESFNYLNRNRWALDDLPQTLHKQNVEFMLVNECRPTNVFLSTGYITDRIETTLKQWFETPRHRDTNATRILVGHVPSRRKDGRPLPFRRRLVGGSLIRQALTERSLDLSLCGHIHDGFVRTEPSGAAELCAGSLATSGNAALINLDNTTREFTIDWHDFRNTETSL